MKYEYRIVNWSKVPALEQTIEIANLGREGWRMVHLASVVVSGSFPFVWDTAVFEREIERGGSGE